MTASKIGYGIAIAHCTTSGGSYTTFAELLSLTPPPVTGAQVKVARSDNAAAIIEKIPGWVDIGDAELELTYVAGGGAAIYALNMTPLYFKVTYPLVGAQSVGDTELWNGFICDISRQTPLQGAMTVKVKVAVNGAITFTAGS